MSKRRDVIEQQIKLLLTGYRSSDFTNEHMVSVFMGNLDSQGVFRADNVDKLAKAILSEANTPAAASPEEAAPLSYYVRVDEDDSSYVCLYCSDCEEDIDGFDEPRLRDLVQTAAVHHRERHM